MSRKNPLRPSYSGIPPLKKNGSNSTTTSKITSFIFKLAIFLLVPRVFIFLFCAPQMGSDRYESLKFEDKLRDRELWSSSLWMATLLGCSYDLTVKGKHLLVFDKEKFLGMPFLKLLILILQRTK